MPYPDNIRDYDHDPRSPFYSASDEMVEVNNYIDNHSSAYDMISTALFAMLQETRSYGPRSQYLRFINLIQAVHNHIGTEAHVCFMDAYTDTEDSWGLLAELYDLISDHYPVEFQEVEVSPSYSRQIKKLCDRIDKIKATAK